jgi:hypothetical protein
MMHLVFDIPNNEHGKQVNSTDLIASKWLDNDFTEPHFQRTTKMLN